MDVLTDVLNALELKGWLRSRREVAPPWRYDFAASRDSIFHILSCGGGYLCVEGEPEVEELADAVGLSRSAFSTRFTRLVGEPPIQYLTCWRMHRATRLLKNDVKMETIAKLLGYDSEVAFRKAFKREVGIPPARYRKLG